MAITGDGKTLETAYVVHDYWELKSVCTYDYTGQTDDIKYVKLANDIDCNADAYSNDFEWETIPLYNKYGSASSDYQVIDLNLNNKSIKNVMIANDSLLFKGWVRSLKTSKIHDGKILNIFCNSSKNIINGNSGDNVICCKLENLSMSINGTSLKSFAFSKCEIDCCAIYYVSHKLNDSIFVAEVKTPTFINSDFYFDITDCNNKFSHNYSYGDVIWNGCRLGGKIGGNIPNDFLYDANNVVVDVEFTYSGGNNFIRNSTGIINSSKATSASEKLCTLTWVNSTEIKSASELMKKGFVVTDIRPATSTT